MAPYSAEDTPIELGDLGIVEAGNLFEVRPSTLPAGAVPIFDDDLGAVVGYREEPVGGVFKLYDLDGRIVGMEEVGLESPLFDPIDLLFFIGGAFRILAKGTVTGTTRVATKVAATGAARLTTRTLASAVVGAMRATFKGLSVRSLKFTATTAAHMATPGRHVPLHILHLALKYGKRAADPQGVRGAFLYTTKMLKNGKEYVLEVVVRESDWTILHFLYK